MNMSFIFCLLFCYLVAVQSKCTPTDCPIEFFNQAPHAKSNVANAVYLGNLYNNAVDSNSLVKYAITNINNDPTILPNVRLELHHLRFAGPQEEVIATLKMRDLGVDAMVLNVDDDHVVPSHTIAQAYQIPQFVCRATADQFKQKIDYPMVSRVFPTSTSITEGIAALIKSFNYSGALLVTTKDTTVAASAVTLTEQSAELGIPNVFSVSITNYPTDADIDAALQKCKGFINEYQLRPIVFLTTVATGTKMLAAMAKANLYGPDFMYILNHDMTRGVLGNLAPAAAHPLLQGSFLFFPVDGRGTMHSQLIANWGTLNRTVYPGALPAPTSQWFVYDAVYAYAHALHNILKAGVPFASVNHTDILKTVYNVSFMGASGQVAFDKNRDYVSHNGFTVFNLLNATSLNFSTASMYSPVTKKFTQLIPYLFWGLSSQNPNPGFCRLCVYGTCNAASQCVCNPGYKGEFCTDEIHKSNMGDLLKWVIPVIAVVVLAAFATVFYFKHRREQLVKKLAEQQRSDIARSEIKILDRIGRGASGCVYKAVFRGTEVAVKSLLSASTSSSVVEAFKMETAMMCALRHPNIVLFMGSCFDAAQKEMLLVMEYCSHGSLHDLLNDPQMPLPYELLLHLATQAAQGVNFLHESNPPIIHRDLKSHNILLDDKYNAKISDFGLTRFKEVNKTSGNARVESLGTVFWSAPEVLSGNPHTEKADCYSFGVILWEMFHRTDPYPGMDLVNVAMDVMNKDLRPKINPTTPTEIQGLIKDCWHKDPNSRPDFLVIMKRLRALSMLNPMNHMTTSSPSYRLDAPTGFVYIVHVRIPALYSLFDSLSRPTGAAYSIFNQLVRTNLELYGGYEARMMHYGFFLSFAAPAPAINFCIATQVSLLHLQWPQEILNHKSTAEVVVGGTTIWRGPRVRMSIHSGTPNVELDSTTGRYGYTGPVVDKAKSILKATNMGSIVMGRHMMEELETKKANLIENFEAVDLNESLADGEDIFEVLPESLAKRKYESNTSPFVVSLEDAAEEATLDAPTNQPVVNPSWLINYNKLAVKESIGKGQVGDYSRGIWKSKEVAIKVLVNQKLREPDYISLISDVSLLSKTHHPNLLTVYGVCLKKNNISIILDYVANGSLRDILNSDKAIPYDKIVKVAAQVASGMQFLTSQSDEQLRIHDNFKSNNILVTNDWQVKITDYGQTNIKDLARTMTSISSVAWTAPEALTGDKITTKSSVYSFGIILWEMVSRKVPYFGEHPLKVVTKITNGFRPPIPSDCPINLKTMIENCWAVDPHQRPSWHVLATDLSNM